MTKMNRRRLLQSSSAIAALGALGACAGESDDIAEVEVDVPPVPDAAEPANYAASSIPDGIQQLEQLASGETTSLALTEAAIARRQSHTSDDQCDRLRDL